MSHQENWRPSCSIQMLHIRAAMLRSIRDCFRGLGYLEVETPCLSRDIVLDAWLEPIEMIQNGEAWYLQTSPEAFMKRLIAAGSGSIFQVSRVFRSGEIGTRHNPEFTMVEWYGVNTTWSQQMAITESIVRASISAASEFEGVDGSKFLRPAPFAKTTYAEAFQRVFGIDVHRANGQALMDCARSFDVPLPENSLPTQADDILNAMLAFAIEPGLGRCFGGDPSEPAGGSGPEFLFDYPPSQAALAITSDDFPSVARRFELYINGIELCNGYQELTDVLELNRRDKRQSDVRRKSDLRQLPGAARMEAAMRHGLPECSGVALGFDRLVMVATGAEGISQVQAFSSEIA